MEGWGLWNGRVRVGALGRAPGRRRVVVGHRARLHARRQALCQRALRTRMNRPPQRQSSGCWVTGTVRFGLRSFWAPSSPTERPGGVLAGCMHKAAGHVKLYLTHTLPYLELHQPALLFHLRGLLRGAARLLGLPLRLRSESARRPLSDRAVHAARGAASTSESCGRSCRAKQPYHCR